ncbi:hypothetical protein [Paenibacillus sp. Leaf72]|uniref:hypothetical protein n=1 Tax=Paenibacillus sp. Leaf72 TaxID=1736234 RepID=UPI0006F1DE9F|nr:hypothetical protein [Paenibacillus sp. Leaf72]KQO04341.1 hypothetical protein ASF12_12385 [Paenibacillus sp. Leaf72]
MPVSGAKIYVRTAATTGKQASYEQVLVVVSENIKIVTIAGSSIAGKNVPVVGERPVTVLADTTDYTATIGWLPAHSTFAVNTAYTATITITPKNGYT